jgi:hypothetical protein
VIKALSYRKSATEVAKEVLTSSDKKLSHRQIIEVAAAIRAALWMPVLYPSAEEWFVSYSL